MKTFTRIAGAGMILALLVLALASVAAFTAPAPTFYGTARAPHSDALTSWLSGTLGFYFHNTSHNTLLLRPSIAVMYSSILTLSGSIAAIPVVFAALYGAGLAAAGALLGVRGRLALLVFGGLFYASRTSLLQPLSPDSLNTDFPAFTLTVSGLLLALAALADRVPTRASRAVLAAGWALLGVATAIRGPGLLFGPPLLLLTLFWYRAGCGAWAPALRTTLPAALAFALPVLGDSALRSALGVDAQGLIAFYSFYSDPTHTLTNEAYFRMVALKPPSGEVLRDYAAFVLSPEGRAVVWESFLERLTLDGATLLNPVGFPFVLAGAWLASVALAAGTGWRRPGLWPELAVGLAVGLAVTAVAVLGRTGLLDPAWSVLALLGLVLLGAWPTRQVVPAALALTYLFGTLFLILTGTKHYDRVAFSYLFALYLAPLWLVLGARLDPWTTAQRRFAAAAAAAAGLFLLVLCAANPLLPTPMKTAYRTGVSGQAAAIKISEDAALDRSVYFSGGREILYTRADGLPVGTVRRYTSFENPNGSIGVPEEIDGLRAFNALFQNPGRFVE